MIEREHAEWFLAERVVPGTEITETAMSRGSCTGESWRNAGIMVRFSPSSAARRIDTLLARYQPPSTRHGVVDLSVGYTVEYLRTAHRTATAVSKCYPAMIRHLADRTPSFQQPKELVIRRVTDPRNFATPPIPQSAPHHPTPPQRFRTDARAALGAVCADA